MKSKSHILNSFKNRNIISMRDFSKEEILQILDRTKEIKASPPKDTLKGKIMASCFFEPSTRTRLSFESAMKKLGGDVIGFAEGRSSSTSKKETLHDTLRVIGEYADLIVIRHPLDGAARLAVEATQRPVINAGDGSNQHPTQTLLDLFTIQECQGRLEDLHIAFAGDLKYGRTVHSLVQAASHFNMRMYFIAPNGLELPKQMCEELKRRSILFSFHPSLQEIMPKLDIVYMTRIQEERMPNDWSFSNKSYIMNN
jgi:aspartate carbamoyltransferase catalytic subunit